MFASVLVPSEIVYSFSLKRSVRSICWSGVSLWSNLPPFLEFVCRRYFSILLLDIYSRILCCQSSVKGPRINILKFVYLVNR
jgi:hypothetical protein